jgi:hypothetical protein
MSWSEHSELQKAVHLLLLLFLWTQKLISLTWALYCYCHWYSTIDFKGSIRVDEIKLKVSDYTIPFIITEGWYFVDISWNWGEYSIASATATCPSFKIFFGWFQFHLEVKKVDNISIQFSINLQGTFYKYFCSVIFIIQEQPRQVLTA